MKGPLVCCKGGVCTCQDDVGERLDHRPGGMLSVGTAEAPNPWFVTHREVRRWTDQGWWARQWPRQGALEHSRPFSQAQRLRRDGKDKAADEQRLKHVSESGSARMVSIAEKRATRRVATAACRVQFSDARAGRLVAENQTSKGDVLAVARVAGIMAAKRTAELIPLCHPLALSRVTVELAATEQAVEVRATAECEGKTGVEMEALTAASTAALTIYDMCKAVDWGMRIEGLRVVLKDGGRSGRCEGE